MLQCSIRTIENCSDLCAVLFSDLCHCSATLHTPSLSYDSVSLAVSLLEDVLAGQQLVVGGSILGAVRPVLELLGVDWVEEEDSNNNSAINPDTRAIKIRHMHMHKHMPVHVYVHMHMHMHLHMHMHMHMLH